MWIACTDFFFYFIFILFLFFERDYILQHEADAFSLYYITSLILHLCSHVWLLNLFVLKDHIKSSHLY